MKWLDGWRYRRAIRLVRREMALLGYPLDDLSDEEVEERMLQVADAIRKVGITCAQAAQNLHEFAVAAQRAQEEAGAEL